MSNIHWPKSSLNSLCSRIGDGIHGTPKYVENSDYPFINGNNLKQGSIQIPPETKKVPRSEFEKYFIAFDEKTLFLSINGTLGSLAKYRGESVILGKSAAYINCSKVHVDFLYYYLQLGSVQQQMWNIATGSTIKNLSLASIRNLQVPTPPIPEQQKIAAVLSALDAKIDCNNRINAELEAMAKTLYDYWFVQFDFPDTNGKPYKSSGGKMVYNPTLKREIPAGWKDGTLKDLVSLEYGKPLKADTRSGSGYPVIGSSGVMDYHAEYLVNGPGIVVGRKGTVGAVTYIHDNFFPIDTTYFVRPLMDIKFYYLKFLLESLGLQKMNSDSAVPGLNREAALRTSTVAPPVDAIQKFESTISAVFSKQHNILKENQHLTQLRDWLLPMLMNGQVTVA